MSKIKFETKEALYEELQEFAHRNKGKSGSPDEWAALIEAVKDGSSVHQIQGALLALEGSHGKEIGTFIKELDRLSAATGVPCAPTPSSSASPMPGEPDYGKPPTSPKPRVQPTAPSGVKTVADAGPVPHGAEPAVMATEPEGCNPAPAAGAPDPAVSQTGTPVGVEYLDIDDIEIDPDMCPFERSTAVEESIRASMEKEGFMPFHPVKVWYRGANRKCIAYDGHTRLAVARKLKISRIPVVKRPFSSKDDCLEAAILEQVDRRNLSLVDKFTLVRVLSPIEQEKARKRHGKQLSEYSDNSKGKTDDIIGAKIGLSADTVAKMRALIEASDPNFLEQVYEDKMSISGAYAKMKGKDGRREAELTARLSAMSEPATETSNGPEKEIGQAPIAPEGKTSVPEETSDPDAKAVGNAGRSKWTCDTAAAKTLQCVTASVSNGGTPDWPDIVKDIPSSVWAFDPEKDVLSVRVNMCPEVVATRIRARGQKP